VPSLMDCGFVSQMFVDGNIQAELGAVAERRTIISGRDDARMNKSPFIEPREVLSNVERDANRVVLHPVAQRGAGLASALAHCIPGWVRS